jgi:K+/H+ antiporter YhaU regulatory subunit KhtT
MLVEKPGQHARSAGPDTVIEPGDQLTVFGRYENIRRAFHARERFTDD